MAPLYFCLNLFFSGFLFISTALPLEYCEFIVIPLEEQTVPTNLTILRSHTVVSCYYFSFERNSKFQENEQSQIKIGMKLTGGKNAEYHTQIQFIKNHQLETLKRSIKCDVVTGIGEFDVQFIFNIRFGV